ncbi:hypothetical protein [Parasphingorhabdus pacifica]
MERVAHAREIARQETFDRLAPEFTDERRAALDSLLVDPTIGEVGDRVVACVVHAPQLGLLLR